MSYKSVDKEKIKLIMIYVRAQMFTNNHRILPIFHSGDNSKSGPPIEAVFHF